MSLFGHFMSLWSLCISSFIISVVVLTLCGHLLSLCSCIDTLYTHILSVVVSPVIVVVLCLCVLILRLFVVLVCPFVVFLCTSQQCFHSRHFDLLQRKSSGVMNLVNDDFVPVMSH